MLGWCGGAWNRTGQKKTISDHGTGWDGVAGVRGGMGWRDGNGRGGGGSGVDPQCLRNAELHNHVDQKEDIKAPVDDILSVERGEGFVKRHLERNMTGQDGME